MRLQAHHLALLLAIHAPPTFGAQTYRLEPLQLLRPFSPLVYLEWRPEPPADAGVMPAFRSAMPLFSSLELGDRPPMLVAADVVQEGGEGRCTVYLDANRNGSLAGERAYPMGPVELDGVRLVATEEIAIALRHHTDAGDVVGRYAFRLAAEQDAQAPCGPPHAVYVEYGHSTVVDLGGTPVRLTVCDADGDGKLTVRRGAEGDRFGLSTDPAVCPDPRSFVPLRSPLEFAGAYYDISLRPDGGQVTLGPHGGPVACLNVSGRDAAGNRAVVTRLEAIGQDAVEARTEVGGPITLLPGAYTIAYSLGGGLRPETYHFSIPAPLDLEPGATASLDCGGPLSLDVGVTALPLESGWVLQVTAGARTGAGHRLEARERHRPEAKVAVLNLDGEIVAEANLDGGAGAVMLPGATAGARYMVRVAYDTLGWQGPITRQIPVTLKAPVG